MNIIHGKLQYKNRKYGVLNASLSDEIAKKVEEYDGDKKWIDPSSPWRAPQLLWVLEENKLYLEKLYVDGLLEELMGSNKIFASWIDELQLLIEDKTICKTYEKKDSYLKEKITLHLDFDKGVFLREEKQAKLYTNIETKNNIDRYTAYTTFRMDSNDLRIYLEDEMQAGEDQLLPIFSDFITNMLSEDDDISLDMDDLKEVLSRGDEAIFAYITGKDIDKLIRSLISSITNENLLNPKGCLLHLMINKKYPRKSIIKIIEEINEGFNFDFEPLEGDIKAPYYAGTRFVNALDEDEVSVMILVSI